MFLDDKKRAGDGGKKSNYYSFGKNLEKVRNKYLYEKRWLKQILPRTGMPAKNLHLFYQNIVQEKKYFVFDYLKGGYPLDTLSVGKIEEIFR